MTRVGLTATASYLPKRVMTAAEVAAASGIPEDVIVGKFGLRGKHVAAPDEHVSDLSLQAARSLLEETDVDPGSIDVVMYYGSTWKDYSVWQVSPLLAHELGCTNAVALEFDNVSHGTPMALRVARDLLRAEEELRTILLVAACRESYLLDYSNERSRFMFNFGDGSVAGLLQRDATQNELLGCYAITDGSLSRQVKVPRGGSVNADDGYGFLDVEDPGAMKERLDRVSMENFVRAAVGAVERSGARLEDVAYLCGIHMKPSMHEALIGALGLDPDRAAYLDDTGHMSGVDPLLALDRAARKGVLADGELVLLLAAGTGYTWAASVIRWGPSESQRR
jgi:3-oxoacyl-[acyl-carrier-protein] synthase-3